MRIRVYGVLTSIFLCMWSALSTRNQVDRSTKTPDEGCSSNQAEETNLTYDHIIRPLYLYHAIDYYYHSVLVDYNNTESTTKRRQRAEDHTNISRMDWGDSKILVQSPTEDEIKNQYMYIASTINDDYRSNYKAEIIMLNFYLTVQAYEVAIYFRICVFFYSNVTKNLAKTVICSILSSYMGWYFSYMLEEKVNGLCEIEKHVGAIPISKQLNASYVCQIFRQLSLDFVKLPQDLTNTFPIIKHDWNLYKPDVLINNNMQPNYKKFVSVLQQYKFPKKTKKQSQNNYDEMVLDQIGELIMKTYTEKFSHLMCYMNGVTLELYYSSNNCYWKPNYDFIKKYIWGNAEIFIEIMKLPSNEKRGVYNSITGNGNNIFVGDEIFRSNAVEIVRQISYIYISSRVTSAGINEKELKAAVNSGEPRCYVRIAPENLNVDYSIALKDD